MDPIFDEESLEALRHEAPDADDTLALWVFQKQHERTLAWVRERLAAGEHLDDILAEQ